MTRSTDRTRALPALRGAALATAVLMAAGLATAGNRPFWTEKSAFVEGEDLYVVGIASRSQTVEEGRLKAFEQGKVELMNYAQLTGLEAKGLVIETQMTFEEEQPDGTVTVFRLLKVPAMRLLELQGRLRSKTAVQQAALERAVAQTAAALKTLEQRQKALSEQQHKLEALSQELEGQIQARERTVTTLKRDEERLKQQQLDVEKIARRIQQRIAEQNKLIEKHIRCGMTKQEVINILGPPSGHDSLHLYYGDAALDFNAGNVLQSIVRRGALTSRSCP